MATNAEAGATRPPSITSCGLLATERLGSTSGVLKRQGFYWCVELNWARFFWALRTISLHIHLTLLLRESCKTCFSTCDCDLTLSLSLSQLHSARPASRVFECFGKSFILELTLIVGSAGLLDPRCHRRVGLKAIEWRPAASEIYSLCFFEHTHGIMELRFCPWNKWGRLVPESSCEGFFLKNCCQFHLSTSCKSASVYRLLCVKTSVCESFRV